eukprot:365763-Chlamydomonas_euryale.AAC.25
MFAHFAAFACSGPSAGFGLEALVWLFAHGLTYQYAKQYFRNYIENSTDSRHLQLFSVLRHAMMRINRIQP